MKHMPMAYEYKEPTEGELFKERLESARDPYHKRMRNVDARVSAHDSAGFETEFVNLSCYDDGAGNRIAEGDLSMQRLMESGMARPQEPDYPTPYNTKRGR